MVQCSRPVLLVFRLCITDCLLFLQAVMVKRVSDVALVTLALLAACLIQAHAQAYRYYYNNADLVLSGRCTCKDTAGNGITCARSAPHQDLWLDRHSVAALWLIGASPWLCALSHLTNNPQSDEAVCSEKTCAGLSNTSKPSHTACLLGAHGS